MTWVLLRGLTREARHWGDFASQWAMALAADGCLDQVLALDLPGNGRFCHQASPPSVQAMVAFARGQLRVQGVQPPYHLLAMSLGGMVASDWAQRYPQEVARLVLVNTSLRPFSGASDRLRPGSWLALLRLAVRWQRAEAAERLIHQLTCRRVATRDDDLAAWLQIRRSAPVSAANAARQLWAAARFGSAAPAPPCPVLVLSSAADALVHPRCSASLATAWGARHQQHPWAGHDLPHDAPEWVCQQLLQWLAPG